jgi:arginyl-tRNA synthetase
LDPAPPLEIQAARSPEGDAVVLSWQNFLQSSFAETVIQRSDGRTIYEGTGTNFVWRSDVNGDETFRFFSRDKAGRLSKPESYTVLPVEGLRHRAE